MTELKLFLEDMLSMSTGADGRTLQIHFSRPVTKEDRQAFADALNAIVRGQLTPSPQPNVRGIEPTEEMLIAGEEAYHSAPRDEDGCTQMAAAFRAMLRHLPREPQAQGLKHPEYAHGISDAELIREAIAFCDEELDAYEGMEYDDDCEVCCQRSNTFIRELVARLERSATPSPQPNVVGEPHPDDLAVDRFAAVMKAKLAQKRAEGRGGWDNPDECSIEWLSELLRSHVEKADPVDVGNFAMMIHQRGGRICK